MFAEKILSIEKLAEKVASAKAEGKKMVHCHGVFDLLHIGHIRHFEEAKSYGDLLVVTVTADAHVNKGSNHPAFTSELRLQALASLEVVDYVAENSWPTAVETIKILKPDILQLFGFIYKGTIAILCKHLHVLYQSYFFGLRS